MSSNQQNVSGPGGGGGGGEPDLSPAGGGKKRSIDDIIDHMTADLQSYDGQYILLGSTPHPHPHQPQAAGPPPLWPEYGVGGQSPPQLPQGVLGGPVFLQQPHAPPLYDLQDRKVADFQPQHQHHTSGLFYGGPSPPRVLQGPEGGPGPEMIGMVDMGNGNFVNVVFNTATPPAQLRQYAAAMPPPQPPPAPSGPADPMLTGYIYHQQQSMVAAAAAASATQMRDYGLFAATPSPPATAPAPTTPAPVAPQAPAPNQQLIESLVGNWLPNQSGTYSPFGVQNAMPLPTATENGLDERCMLRPPSGSGTIPPSGGPLVGGATAANRKPRAVAEVRPMRPTYSDVLTKSPPPFAPACTKPANSSSSQTTSASGNSTPKSDVRKQSNKSNKSGSTKEGLASKPGSSLRRQHSSGSEEATKSSAGNGNGRKWTSMEDLTGGAQQHRPSGTGNGASSDQSAYGAQLNEEEPENGRVGERGNGRRANECKRQMKKKLPKQTVAEEKAEALNNHKVGGPGAGTGPAGNKRPLQINNNLQRSANSRSSNVEKNVSSKQAKKGVNGKDDSKSSGLGSASGTKRMQRSGKKRQGQMYIGVLWSKWQHYALLFVNWFLDLIWDVAAMSARLSVHMCKVSLEYTISMVQSGWQRIRKAFGVKGTKWRGGSEHHHHHHNQQQQQKQRRWWHFWSYNFWWGQKQPPKPPEKMPHTPPEGLAYNMAIPATGDDAIRRLLSCKGKDPYSILGVTRTCNDEEIKKYYKRQAVLVHPDKNSQPGAEEAFKILVHAFELIGEPERRSRYDRCVAETHQMENAWTELNDLLTRLHEKMEYTANTIRCTNCGKRHRRTSVQRPCYAARFCAQCRIHHSAREGDIWAESWALGFVWHYYACMEGQVYDITEWASCQAENLQHLKANSHAVQYRIVLGKQQQQNQNAAQQQHHSQASSSQHSQASPQHSQPQQNSQQGGGPDARQSEPDFEEFLNNLYSQSGTNGTMNGSGADGASVRQRRKTRRKK